MEQWRSVLVVILVFCFTTIANAVTVYVDPDCTSCNPCSNYSPGGDGSCSGGSDTVYTKLTDALTHSGVSVVKLSTDTHTTTSAWVPPDVDITAVTTADVDNVVLTPSSDYSSAILRLNDASDGGSDDFSTTGNQTISYITIDGDNSGNNALEGISVRNRNGVKILYNNIRQFSHTYGARALRIWSTWNPFEHTPSDTSDDPCGTHLGRCGYYHPTDEAAKVENIPSSHHCWYRGLFDGVMAKNEQTWPIHPITDLEVGWNNITECGHGTWCRKQVSGAILSWNWKNSSVHDNVIDTSHTWALGWHSTNAVLENVEIYNNIFIGHIDGGYPYGDDDGANPTVCTDGDGDSLSLYLLELWAHVNSKIYNNVFIRGANSLSYAEDLEFYNNRVDNRTARYPGGRILEVELVKDIKIHHNQFLGINKNDIPGFPYTAANQAWKAGNTGIVIGGYDPGECAIENGQTLNQYIWSNIISGPDKHALNIQCDEAYNVSGFWATPGHVYYNIYASNNIFDNTDNVSYGNVLSYNIFPDPYGTYCDVQAKNNIITNAGAYGVKEMTVNQRSSGPNVAGDAEFTFNKTIWNGNSYGNTSPSGIYSGTGNDTNTSPITSAPTYQSYGDYDTLNFRPLSDTSPQVANSGVSVGVVNGVDMSEVLHPSTNWGTGQTYPDAIPNVVLADADTYGYPIGPYIWVADDIYVDPNCTNGETDYLPGGTGSCSGGDKTVYQTLSAALAVAQSGQTVKLSQEVHLTGSVDVPVGVNITSVESDASTAILRASSILSGSNAMLDLKSTNPGTDGSQEISYIQLDGEAPGIYSSQAIHIRNRSNVKVHHNIIREFRYPEGSKHETGCHGVYAWSDDPSSEDLDPVHGFPGTGGGTYGYDLLNADFTKDVTRWPINPVENLEIYNNEFIDVGFGLLTRVDLGGVIGGWNLKGLRIYDNLFDIDHDLDALGNPTVTQAIVGTYSVWEDTEIYRNVIINHQYGGYPNGEDVGADSMSLYTMEIWGFADLKVYNNKILRGALSIARGDDLEIYYNFVDNSTATFPGGRIVEAPNVHDVKVHHNKFIGVHLDEIPGFPHGYDLGYMAGNQGIVIGLDENDDRFQGNTLNAYIWDNIIHNTDKMAIHLECEEEIASGSTSNFYVINNYLDNVGDTYSGTQYEALVAYEKAQGSACNAFLQNNIITNNVVTGGIGGSYNGATYTWDLDKNMWDNNLVNTTPSSIYLNANGNINLAPGLVDYANDNFKPSGPGVWQLTNDGAATYLNQDGVDMSYAIDADNTDWGTGSTYPDSLPVVNVVQWSAHGGVKIGPYVLVGAVGGDIYASQSGGGTECDLGTPCTLKYAVETKAAGQCNASSPCPVYLLDGDYGLSTPLVVGEGISLTAQNQTTPPSARIYASGPLTTSDPLIYFSSSSQGSNGNQSLSYIELDGVNGTARIAFEVENRNNVSVHNNKIHDFYADSPYNNVENSFGIIVESVSGTEGGGVTEANSNWWDNWPIDVQPIGTDTNINVIWPITTPVSNFHFYDNDVDNVDPMYPYGLSNSSVYNNNWDNSNVHPWIIKGTCTFSSNFDIYNNTFLGADPYTNEDRWRIELWVLKSGSEVYDNNLNGPISLQWGKQTKAYDNTITFNPWAGTNVVNGELGDELHVGIDFKGQSYGEITCNTVSHSGIGIEVGTKNISNYNWIVTDTLIQNNVVFNSAFDGISIIGSALSGREPITQNITVTDNILDGSTANEILTDTGIAGYTRSRNGVKFDQEGDGYLDNISVSNNTIGEFTRAPGYAVLSEFQNGPRVTNLIVDSNTFYGNTFDDWNIGTDTNTFIPSIRPSELGTNTSIPPALPGVCTGQVPETDVPVRVNTTPLDFECISDPMVAIDVTITATDESPPIYCKIHDAAGFDYDTDGTIMDPATGGSSGSTFTHTLTYLPCDNSYTRYVKCRDNLGNTNSNDLTVQFSISPKAQAPSSGIGIGTEGASVE